MLLRDRLIVHLREMGTSPDYVRLATDVLGISNAPPALAKRLVEQALVVEDRRDEWLRRGEQICQVAPTVPAVYVLRDADGRPLYVGKANNLRRRLRTHFAPRRWRSLKAEFARAAHAEWQTVGSEVEALVREASLIRALTPAVNIQVGMPRAESRAVPEAVRRDVVIVLPSAVDDSVELLAVRAAGPVMLVRVPRDGTGMRGSVTDVWRFFRPDECPEDNLAKPAARQDLRDEALRGGGGPLGDAGKRDGSAARALENAFVVDACAPIVWSWLAGRGASSTRLDPHDASVREFERRVRLLLSDRQLFQSRLIVSRSPRMRQHGPLRTRP